MTALTKDWKIFPLQEAQTVLKFAVRCAHHVQVALLTCDTVTPPCVQIAIGAWLNTKTIVTSYHPNLPESQPHSETSVSFNSVVVVASST